jgi:hypothetical protein
MKLLYLPSALHHPFSFRDPSSTPAINIDIPDLNLKQTSLVVLLDVHIDGEMCVNVSHLVLKALCDTDDQIVDEGSDCAEGSNVLSCAMVKFDLDDIFLWMREVDRQVVEVLGELAYTISIRISSAYISRPFVAYLVVPRR